MVGSNYTDELQAAGLSVPGELLKLWDFSRRRRRADREGSAVVSSATCATRERIDRCPACSPT